MNHPYYFSNSTSKLTNDLSSSYIIDNKSNNYSNSLFGIITSVIIHLIIFLLALSGLNFNNNQITNVESFVTFEMIPLEAIINIQDRGILEKEGDKAVKHSKKLESTTTDLTTPLSKSIERELTKESLKEPPNETIKETVAENILKKENKPEENKPRENKNQEIIPSDDLPADSKPVDSSKPESTMKLEQEPKPEDKPQQVTESTLPETDQAKKSEKMPEKMPKKTSANKKSKSRKDTKKDTGKDVDKDTSKDAIDSILQSLEEYSEGENVTATQSGSMQTKNKGTYAKGGSYDEDLPISITEKMLVKQQIEKNWRPPIGAKDLSEVQVILHLTLKPDGKISKVVVKKLICPGNASTCNLTAESAIRAVWKASPIKQLMPERYNAWKEFDLLFDPKDFAQ